MGFFSYDYESSGAGISKNRPDKKRFVVFFEIMFRKFWKLMGLNLLYLITCVPIVTIGPATAGLTKVLKNFSLERPTFWIADYFDSFKKNFKQSFILGLINVVAFASIAVGCYIYPMFGKQSGNMFWYFIFAITLSVGITFLIMNFYAYLMIVSTDLPFKSIIKNSLALTFIEIKKNLLTFFIVISVLILLFYLLRINIATLMLLPILPFAQLGLLICFNSYPAIQKYIINPYYEDRDEVNPEEANNQPLDDKEVIFVDRGGTEAPVDKRKQSKEKSSSSQKRPKGKIIS